MTQKVLIIDDSPEIHALLRARLKGEQIELYSADCGTAGLSLAAKLRPDVILLDIQMPGMDGFEVCRQLRTSPATVNAPIIFISGADSTEDKISGLDLGATDYVTKPFDPAELRARVRVALRNAYLMDLLARKAMIDGLTGLWNRSYLDTRLLAEVAHAQRTQRSLSCILLDVDHFKQLNDRFGHSFGDDVLRMIAMALGSNCRAEDVVCRYGGEEFAVLLPNTSASAGIDLAERFRRAIENETMQCKLNEVNTTASFGVAQWLDGEPKTMIEAADAGLYAAKKSGRNRVCVMEIPAGGAVATSAA